MNEDSQANGTNKESDFSRQIGAQAARTAKGTHCAGTKRSVWFGLGMSGLIGWSGEQFRP